MKVVFRVDASTAMGTGHVMRCRTLADELKKNGCSVKFVTRAHSGHLASLLNRDGFSVILLPSPAPGATRNSYADWLGVSQQEDAEQTILAINGRECDWLIVDHYGLNFEWERRLQPHTKKLMVIDDLANRKHHCDVLLDQNYVKDFLVRYGTLVPSKCKLLLGPRFALLRPVYARFRETMSARSGALKRVLVFMGGSDNTNITGKVLTALSTFQTKHLEVDVVVGSNFVHRDKVIAQAELRPQTRILYPRPHLADLMARADFAIGAGGSTTWERLCMGLPSLVISIAANQIPGISELDSQGLVVWVGDVSDISSEKISNAVVTFISGVNNTKNVSLQEIVDGKGLFRIVRLLLEIN